MPSKSASFWGVPAALATLLGCGPTPQAWGEPDAVVVVATDSLWSAVGEVVRNALEPTVEVGREERAFRVTHVSPYDSAFVNLRKFQQVVTIGRPADPWVAPALAQGTGPAADVWARSQQVRAVPVRSAHELGDVERALPVVAAGIAGRFRERAVHRMYRSGVDTALGRRLEEEAGFRLRLPTVYRAERQGVAYVFRHHAQVRGREVLRTVLVTWRTAADSSDVLEWRTRALADAGMPQRIAAERTQVTARAVRGAWSSEYRGLPAGGPFLTRVVQCPQQGRTYLVDGWLYAPGRSAKYEYVIQLETLLNTFRCGAQTRSAPNR